MGEFPSLGGVDAIADGVVRVPFKSMTGQFRGVVSSCKNLC